jgi:uncharacterized protein (DUF433 family)
MPDGSSYPRLLGIGLYTVADAARLLHMPAGTARRWLNGYSYGDRGEQHHSAPLWPTDIAPVDDNPRGLSFRDLMELRMVHALVSNGVPLQAVRRGIEIARSEIGEDRPLSTARLKTDGVSWFLQVGQQTAEPRLVDLVKRRGQYGFHALIAPSFQDVDFEGIEPARWWPVGHGAGIVLDPRRCFGSPIVTEYGVPTAALALTARAEGSEAAVARYYEIPVKAVRNAIEFERGLAA